MIEAFVALGSNLGDRLANLGAAVDWIAREPGLSLRRVSLAYQTEPVGPPQPRYLNAAAQVGSLLTPRVMLQRLHFIEDALGRVRRERWGARQVDLDLLLYGDRVLEGTHPSPLSASKGVNSLVRCSAATTLASKLARTASRFTSPSSCQAGSAFLAATTA